MLLEAKGTGRRAPGRGKRKTGGDTERQREEEQEEGRKENLYPSASSTGLHKEWVKMAKWVEESQKRVIKEVKGKVSSSPMATGVKCYRGYTGGKE